MSSKAQVKALVAWATVLTLMLNNGLQAQLRTCEEIQAAIDTKQAQQENFVAELTKATAEKKCFENVLDAIAESQAAFDALDESERESAAPTVQYPECSNAYGQLTVEQAAELFVAAEKAESDAKAGIMTTVLELNTEKANYSDGCN